MVQRLIGEEIEILWLPGKGTTFEIYFPEYEAESVARLEKPEESIPQGTETILIAEDEELLLNRARDSNATGVHGARGPHPDRSLVGCGKPFRRDPSPACGRCLREALHANGSCGKSEGGS